MIPRKRKWRLPGEPEYDEYGRRIRLLVDLDMKERLCEAQNWRCALCGGRMNTNERPMLQATLEHVIPFGKGGPDDESNFVITCMDCNQKRTKEVDNPLSLVVESS